MDSVILTGAFQLEIFYDSVKYRSLGIMQETLQKTQRLKDSVCSLFSVLVSVDWEKKKRKVIIAQSKKRCQTSLQGKYKRV